MFEYAKENPKKVAVAAIATTPLAFSAGLYFAGFTGAGIAKGSIAASYMSTYGGFITKGSVISYLQSIGAVGMGSTTYVASTVTSVAAVGGSLSNQVTNAYSKLSSWFYPKN